MRLDRVELRARLGGAMHPWVLDELSDAFEGAALKSMKAAADKAKANKRKAADARRARGEGGAKPDREASEDG